MPSLRTGATAALCLSVLLGLLASTASAARVDEVLPLKAKVTGELAESASPVTYGFLMTENARRVSILVKRSRRSKVTPDVRLFRPSGEEVNLASFEGKFRSNARLARITIKDVLDGDGGLWRVEVGAAEGTAGAYTLITRGTDKTVQREPLVVPAGGEGDLEFLAGAGVNVTIIVKRERRNRVLVPEILLDDPNGNEIPEAADAAVSVVRAGRATLKRFVLPVFGKYTLRVGGVTGFGGTANVVIRTAPDRFKGVRPVSVPGPSFGAEPGATARLDATASTKGAGGSLSFVWTQVDGEPVVLSDPTAAMPTFTAPDDAGPLAFDLGVQESGVFGRSVAVAVDVGPKPLADGGASQRVDGGAVVTLSAAGSFAPSGQPLSFAWRQIDGAAVELDDPTAESPTFTAPVADGVLRFGLVADDGTIRSSEDTTVVRVGGSPAALADAGREQFVGRMSTVHLSGLLSERATGVLSGGLAWSRLSGPAVVLDGADTAFPSFTAPRQGGDLLFELRVDGDATSADRVWVHVRDGANLPPRTVGNGPLQADAGPLSLNAAGSTDADGDDPRTRWGQVSGPAATLAPVEGDSVTATFSAGQEVRVFAAQARDDLQFGPPDLIRVAPSGFTLLPLANAGSDLQTVAGVPVALNGAASVGAITFEWRQISGLDWYDVATLDAGFDTSAAQPTFTLPTDLSSLTPTRTLTFELVVNDGVNDSAPDVATVTFSGLPLNGAPIVTADVSDAAPPAGATVTLIGTASDRENDPVTVQWTQTAGPPVNIVPARNVLSPQVTLPDAGTLTFRLVGDDGFDPSLPAEVTIVVNERPTAVTSVSPSSGDPGTLVTISGAASTDPENVTPLAFNWTQLSGPGVSFDRTAESFQFTAPDGAVTFQLVVNDGRQNSSSALASFANDDPPEVNPATNRANAPYGSTVILSANPPQMTSYTFIWRQINPTGADPVITLSSTTAQNPQFTVPLPSSAPYGAAPEATFGVTANDGTLDSDEKTVKVTFFASLNNSAAAGGSNNTVFGLMQNNCLNPCHTGSTNSCPPGTNGRLYPIDTKAEFLTNSVNANSCGGSGGPRIDGTGKDPTNSYLIDRLKGIGGTQMPRGRSALSKTSINLIEDWVSQGAQDN